MNIRLISLLACIAILPATGFAQEDAGNSADALKLAALEALVAAPPERALPLASKVLAGNNSDEVKARALFVLSQIDDPEAQARLLDVARSNGGRIGVEAVRMIGIGGNPESLAGLTDLYGSGDDEMKQAVLEAYMIAGDKGAVYEIAAAATDDGEFSEAVQMLAVMGARDELRKLRERAGASTSLIEAYAISGDVESLRALASDRSDPARQARAIEGLMVAGDDDGLIELYRSASGVDEKRRVLQALVNMDSDLVFDVIDETLAGDR